MYLKDDGTVFWEITFGENGDYWVNDLAFDSGNPDRILAVGGVNTPLENINSCRFYIYNNGVIESEYFDPTLGEDYFSNITNFGNNGDYYTSYIYENASSYPFGEDISIHKYNSNWSYQNSFGMSHAYPDYTGEIISTSDGGAIVIGHSTGVISGGNEVTVAKIGPVDVYPDNLNGANISTLVFIDELDLSSLVTLFPNPSAGDVTLVSETELYESYRIISSNGDILKSGTFHKELNLSFFQEQRGLYFIELIGGTVVPVRIKLMIQ
jgi:hypothetical protein